MSELLQKLKKSSKLEHTDILNESKFFIENFGIPTPVPALNIALGASLKGGVRSGLTVWAGPSKHFKTSYLLLTLKAFLDSDPEAVAIWFDSEFGSPQSYFESFGIDTSRVLHTPIANIEELKFEIMNQLNEIKKEDKIMLCVDSIGNLASKKEVEDALNEKSVADMTRAKQLKSLFRMVTPVLTLKDIPMGVVNHTYQTQELYSKTVVSGGCLAPNSNVRMADGSYKRIDSIVPGEMVMTLEGPQEVTHTWDENTLENGSPECFEVELSNGKKIICSDIHRFMDINGEWKQANQLSPGDLLMDVSNHH